MTIHIISQNPYRILGVLSNSPLRERVGNQNRLTAFAKVGKEVAFPNDFAKILTDKPIRNPESIAAANTAINLDKDQLKYALFWFINCSPMDGIALKHLQAGNIEKAKEIFQKKETYSSLINSGVLAFIDGDTNSGFNKISKVIHNSPYRTELLNALAIGNLQLSDDDIAEMVISELLKEISASKLLSACTNPTDRAIVSKKALDEPISAINSEIAIAKNADAKNPEASLAAGTKLMNSTKVPLKVVKDIAGISSPQYQMVADNVAKQVLQCGINYYNNALDSDVESPRKAMVLQSYALSIAVGQLTKDRCKENCDILKQAVDNMPPAEVAIETRKVKEELKRFCQLPDKISHSVALLNNTKPLLQKIKAKLGSTNAFYLSLSTQVVGNALHNIIEEVNQAQNVFSRMIEDCKKSGISPSLMGSTFLDSLKRVLRDAWQATLQMDSFDMEYEFKTERYNPNRQSLKEMCEGLGISTYDSTPRPVTRTAASFENAPKYSTPRPSTRTTVNSENASRSNKSNASSSQPSSINNSTDSKKEWYENGCLAALVTWIVIGLIAGGICVGYDGDFAAGFCISGAIVLIFSRVFSD